MLKKAIIPAIIGVILFSSMFLGIMVTTGISYEEEDTETVEEIEDLDEDEIDDEIEEKNEREISISESGNEIEIKSEAKSADRKDEFALKLHLEERLEIKLEYESEVENTESENEFEVELNVIFYQLIEFNDQDGNGIFSEENDSIIQSYLIDEFQPVIYEEIPQGNSSSLHYLKISTDDNIFTLHVFVTGEFLNVNSTLLMPTSVKMDIEINNFPYLESTSYLALYTKLESEHGYEYKEESEGETLGLTDQEKAILSNMGNFTAEFSWSETAIIDDIEKEVKLSPIEDEEEGNEKKFYLNYPHGEKIYHDPRLGIRELLVMNPSSVLPSIPGYPLVLLVLGISIMGIFLIIARKRKIA